MKWRTATAAALLTIVGVGNADAAFFLFTSGDNPFFFSGINPESGDPLSAEATFDVVSPGRLEVTLTNTSLYDVMRPTDILTALFFDLDGNPTLTRVSAVLADGSSVLYDYESEPPTTPGSGDIGGEWAYSNDLSGTPGGAKQGISSTGLSVGFTKSDRFPPLTNLDDPLPIDGLNYGITSAYIGPPYDGNSAVTGNVPLIQNSVVFTFDGLPDYEGGLDAAISNVYFVYGTDLDGPEVIPEPASVIVWCLLGLSATGLSWWRRRSGRPDWAETVSRRRVSPRWSDENRAAILGIVGRGRPG